MSIEIQIPPLKYTTYGELMARMSVLWAPPPSLTVAEWASEHRMLSPESGRGLRRYDLSRAPFQRAIMDAWSDQSVQQVTAVGSAQWGKTTIIENCIAHTIDVDPCGLVAIFQNKSKAADFSRERFDPMVRDNQQLRLKVSAKKSRDSNNTLHYKKFMHGYIAFGSSEISGDMASRPVPKAIGDEIDRWAKSSSSEGNPIELLRVRLSTFWDATLLIASTPTNLATSLIWPQWLESSQEHYQLPCPACGTYHKITWENIKWRYLGSRAPDYSSVVIECPHCSRGYDSATRSSLLVDGRWTAENPGVTANRGFHLWSAHASWLDLADLVKEYMAAGEDQGRLQVFYNTRLGLPWEGMGATVEWEDVYNRRTLFGADVPEWVVALFVGVDTQDDRFEATVYGVGLDDEGDERYAMIDHSAISGDPADQDTRNKLDTYILHTPWISETGEPMYPLAAAIDTAGHRADDVYGYCRPRGVVGTDHGKVKIIGIIGRGGESRPLLRRPSRLVNKEKRDRRVYKPWIAGVDGAKSKIYLALSKTEDKGRLYIPKRSPFDEEYCKGLTGEELIVTEKRDLRWVPRQGRRRNEPLDCAVYAMVARHHWGGDIKKLAAEAKRKRPEKAEEAGGQDEKQEKAGGKSRRRPGGWVNGWR